MPQPPALSIPPATVPAPQSKWSAKSSLADPMLARNSFSVHSFSGLAKIAAVVLAVAIVLLWVAGAVLRGRQRRPVKSVGDASIPAPPS